VKSGLRHVRATVDGKRARLAHRGSRRVVVVRPAAGAQSVVVKISGVDRRGKRVALRTRVTVCR
jgi:hypothetical protein